MSEATFDTLSAARALESAGMDTAQAEVVVETVRSAVIQGTATRADIADLRADMRAYLAALELRLTKQLHRQTAILAGLVAAAAALFRVLG